MHGFQDSAGRKWRLELTIGAAKRVRDLLGENLLAPEGGEEPLLARLATDPWVLADVLYVLLLPQAQAAGVSDEEFGASLGADAILDGQTALLAEMADFFHRLHRTDLATAVARQAQLVQAAVEATADRIEQTAEAALAEIRSTSGGPSTASPGSSGSTPHPSRSANCSTCTTARPEVPGTTPPRFSNGSPTPASPGREGERS